MIRRLPFVLVTAGVAMFALWGSRPPTAALPDVSQAVESGLPAGHPVTTMTDFAPAPGPLGDDARLTWAEPENWERRDPSTPMRQAEYEIPGTDGPALLVVYYFGPGQGGPPQANADRWAGQFALTEGMEASDAYRVEELEVNGLPVLTVRIEGTYLGSMTVNGPESVVAQHHALLGAIVTGPDANWYFKMTGPAATVLPQSGAFRALIQSVGFGS